ncbi:hypothetical protein KY314_05040 [Candidatus Woesearchaeota archaeon]|nr:hypothetical protein [Candidatus Woesearchaeota archaeon]
MEKPKYSDKTKEMLNTIFDPCNLNSLNFKLSQIEELGTQDYKECMDIMINSYLVIRNKLQLDKIKNDGTR